MNIATALLLAFNLLSSGRPAKVVNVGHDQAIVIIEGRPGCTAEALHGDPNMPVVVCKRAASR